MASSLDLGQSNLYSGLGPRSIYIAAGTALDYGLILPSRGRVAVCSLVGESTTSTWLLPSLPFSSQRSLNSVLAKIGGIAIGHHSVYDVI